MINVKNESAGTDGKKRLTWQFLLINLVLLLLYGWTLNETSTVSIAVSQETCTAILPNRTLTIACPGLRNGHLGLYSNPAPAESNFSVGPLDWLAPDTAWGSLAAYDEKAQLRWTATFNGTLQEWQAISGRWRTRLGELRPPAEPAFIRRQQDLRSLGDEYQIVARVHRAHDSAGIVLTRPATEVGWAFVVSAHSRRGTWWRWEDGRLHEPLVGVSFQKSFLAQLQSLLRRVLRAHQSALLLLAAAGFLATLLQRTPLGERRRKRWLLQSVAYERILVLLIVLAVFALTLAVALHVLDRIPHVQDSVTYLFQAKTLANGRLWAPAPPLPEFFEQEFLLVRDGRWFGKYPPGFPLLLAVGLLAGGPWLINPLLAALTTPLLFVLGKQLYSRATGLLAAALLLGSPFFLFMSANFLAHGAELFWGTLFMVCWLSALRKPGGRRWAVASGLALGFLFLTRQITAVALGLPFLLVTFFTRLEDGEGAAAAGGVRHLLRSNNERLRRLLIVGLAALPFVILLLAYQWSLTGDPLQDPRLLYWEYDHLGFGQDIGEGQNAFYLAQTEEGLAQIWFHDDSQPPRGHSPARGLYNVQQNLQALERQLFGWLPVLTLAPLWIALLLRPWRGQEWALLLSLLVLTAAYVFYWADGIAYGPRYFYAALGALLLLTARGFRLAGRWLGGHGGRRAMALLLIALVAGSYIANTSGYLRTYHNYNFVGRQKLDLVRENVERPAIVFVEPGLDWWEYGSVFSANDPWLEGPIVFARDRGAQDNLRLMAHFPRRHAYRLSEDGHLQPLLNP